MLKPEYLNIPQSRFLNFEFMCDFVSMHSELEIATFCLTRSLAGGKLDDPNNWYNVTTDNIQNIAQRTCIGTFRTQYVGSASLWDFVHDLKTNLEFYVFLYSILEDELSKKTLLHILLFRLFLNLEYLREVYSPKEYFLPDILPPRKDAVMVDCGAYDGNTALEYMDVYPDYRRIYTYEPVPSNFDKVKETLKGKKNIVCVNKGVADKVGTLNFTSHMSATANRINPNGDKTVEVSTLDMDIQEPVTFIKMDIEGAEQNALIGAKGHIVHDRPQLAICVYHTIADLWLIPTIIYSYNRNQKFYLRYHGNNVPEEFVFYANPGVAGETAGPRDRTDTLDSLKQIGELMQTVTEGIQYSKIKFLLHNDSASVNMLGQITKALGVCSEQVRQTTEKIESGI